MQIVLLDADTLGQVKGIEAIAAFGNLTAYGNTLPAALATRLQEAQIVITNKVKLSRNDLQKAPHLQLICIAATGTDHVDTEAAEELGIIVKNVHNYSTNSVAQTVFSSLLQLTNHIPDYHRYVADGHYSKQPLFTFIGDSFNEIAGKRFGVVGLGNIGKKVAQIAQAFGAEVWHYSPLGHNNQLGIRTVDFVTLLKHCDFISLHIPLAERTKHLFSSDAFEAMKPTAILINTARGGLVSASCLAKAIDKNQIGGAAIDVFEQEPLPPDSPLLQVKNKERLILSPHIAWASRESRRALVEGIVENIKAFLEN